jgi:hypothetical protein
MEDALMEARESAREKQARFKEEFYAPAANLDIALNFKKMWNSIPPEVKVQMQQRNPQAFEETQKRFGA